MAGKIAVRSRQGSSLRECSHCREYADKGYFLQGAVSVQFVCEDCYEQHYAQEYPLAKYVVHIPAESLDSLFGDSGCNTLKAGYLLGDITQDEDTTTVTVDLLLPVTHEGNGHIVYFTPADHINIKKKLADSGHRLVGLYRTTPGGDCRFNALDKALVMDMRNDLVYIMIAGKRNGMLSGMTKNHSPDEAGIVIV